MKRYISSALWAALLCLCLAFTGGAAYGQSDEKLKSQVDSLKAENKDLRRELDVRKATITALEEKIKNIPSNVKGLQDQITALTRKNKELEKRPTKEAVEKIIETRTKELKGKVGGLEKEKENLEKLLSDKQGGAAIQIEGLTKEKNAIQTKLTEANQKAENLEKENAALQEQNKANQKSPFLTIVLVGALILCLVLLFLQVGRVKQLQKRLAVAPTGTPRDAAHKNLDTELRVIIQQIEASEKRVLEALQQSENLSQIALTNFANNLRQQIYTEEPRPTKTPKKEESQPDPTQQTLYQYNLYAEAVSAKGVFSQVNTAKGKEKMFVLELQNADDRKAFYDLNRESPNYATWLSDRGQYLEHSCAIESGAPLAPKRCTTVEKGVAVLEGGEWHVVRPLSLRLS